MWKRKATEVTVIGMKVSLFINFQWRRKEQAATLLRCRWTRVNRCRRSLPRTTWTTGRGSRPGRAGPPPLPRRRPHLLPPLPPMYRSCNNSYRTSKNKSVTGRSRRQISTILLFILPRGRTFKLLLLITSFCFGISLHFSRAIPGIQLQFNKVLRE